MAKLLNVDKALDNILADIHPLASELVTLDKARGRILAEEIRSPLHLPPFPNSSMDGYAVRAEDVTHATRQNPITLRLALDIPAGSTARYTLAPGETARIMTGAPMPDGADAVIPVEETNGSWDHAALPETVQMYKEVQPGDYVRPVGENIYAGQSLYQVGMLLRAVDIGLLASLGLRTVSVVRQPRVVILGSGDELIEPGLPLAHGQIYDSNSYMLAALVEETGAEAIRLPVAKDTLADIRAAFQTALQHKPDMMMSSAGVSVGAADFTRTILEELGQVNFWRINLRPGKPLAFGKVAGIPFFGLPGNPVSAFVTFDVLVRPALLKMAQRHDDATYSKATVAEKMTSDGRRSYIRVNLNQVKKGLEARSTGTQSSGALLSIVTADALMIIPEDMTIVEQGAKLRVKLLKTNPNTGK
jgi:molybdopterin molybdotransferase